MNNPNPTIELLNQRRSIRLYKNEPLSQEEKQIILNATMRAPTAGNMMLYSVIEVTDQHIKEELAKSCDDQPFIAKAPWILIFLADYQRWMDYFTFSGINEKAKELMRKTRTPGEGDMMLAVCDALIAAQTSVVAAEALGIGSCYIGDILEKHEFHKDLLKLPRYAFPITMICFGRSSKEDPDRKLQPRFPQKYIVHQNQYRPLGKDEVVDFEKPLVDKIYPTGKFPPWMDNLAQRYYFQKFTADFSIEMNRSVREIIRNWQSD